MRLAFFSAKNYDRTNFTPHFLERDIECTYFESRLNANTAKLTKDFDGVCAFVNDDINSDVVQELSANGIKLIALRSAGFNHVDLTAAARADITVVRVPEYSPNAVAEHTLALLLGVNRRIHRAYNRVREGNFDLDGLMGYDLCEQTVGVIGAGKIGSAVAKIFRGFESDVLISDPQLKLGVRDDGSKVVELDALISQSNVITLHCPLTPETYHLIDDAHIAKMVDKVTIINTSRGGLIDTQAVINHLKSGKIGALGIDVYEEEGDLFFEDLSNTVLQDDTFARLLTFPNVLITGHQAFFTEEAVFAIASITASNIYEFFKNGKTQNSVGLNLVSSKE